MSRHQFDTKAKGRDVRVIVGYDRPLRELFYQVWDKSYDGGGDILTSSMHRSDLNLTSLDVVTAALLEEGIDLPAQYKEILAQEQAQG